VKWLGSAAKSIGFIPSGTRREEGYASPVFAFIQQQAVSAAAGSTNAMVTSIANKSAKPGAENTKNLRRDDSNGNCVISWSITIAPHSRN
jgi:hypothetical protein